jgi:hypothetical protein
MPRGSNKTLDLGSEMNDPKLRGCYATHADRSTPGIDPAGSKTLLDSEYAAFSVNFSDARGRHLKIN